jgi:lipopolysaccharide biosynthesis glycosyltransferase
MTIRPIVTVSDSRYLSGSQFLLQSILDNYHGEERLKFYIVHQGGEISQEEQSEFIYHFADRNVSVLFVTSPDLESQETKNILDMYADKAQRWRDCFGYENRMHPSWKALLKMWIVDAVPEDDILFLDSDAFVFRSIHHLFDFKTSRKFAASLDIWPSSYTQHSWCQENNEFKLFNNDMLTPIGNYRTDFNSGVFLTSLNYWREQKFVEKTKEYIQKYIIVYGDQDILNYLFANNYDTLPLQFNTHYKTIVMAPLGIVYDSEPQSPVIVHFCSAFKPLFKRFDGYVLYDHSESDIRAVLPPNYTDNPVFGTYTLVKRKVMIKELYYKMLGIKYEDINIDELNRYIHSDMPYKDVEKMLYLNSNEFKNKLLLKARSRRR